MSDAGSAPELPLRLTYSRSGYFGWQRGCPERGGYTASLEGSPVAGQETTIDGALDELREELRLWIEHLDELAEEHPWHEPGDLGESEASRVVRRLLLDDSLRDGLTAVAGRTEPVLDVEDERLPERDGEDLPIPEIYGYQGDGELQIEVGPSAPTPGWALAWVRHVDERPEEWRVIGRVWASYVPYDGGSWDHCERGDEGALEFWQLERTRW